MILGHGLHVYKYCTLLYTCSLRHGSHNDVCALVRYSARAVRTIERGSSLREENSNFISARPISGRGLAQPTPSPSAAAALAATYTRTPEALQPATTHDTSRRGESALHGDAVGVSGEAPVGGRTIPVLSLIHI